MLWRMDEWERPTTLRHRGKVASLAVLHDGRLVSGNEDGRITIWPNDDGDDPVILQQGARVTSLAVLEDGRLASADTAGRIKLWPQGSSGEPTVLPHDDWIMSIAALPDGRLASAGFDGQIKLWLVDDEKVTAALCLRAGRNLSKAEWTHYIGSATPWQPSCRDRPSSWRTPD
jgi:cytochrome c